MWPIHREQPPTEEPRRLGPEPAAENETDPASLFQGTVASLLERGPRSAEMTVKGVRTSMMNFIMARVSSDEATSTYSLPWSENDRGIEQVRAEEAAEYSRRAIEDIQRYLRGEEADIEEDLLSTPRSTSGRGSPAPELAGIRPNPPR